MPTYYSKQVVTEVDKLLQTPVSEQPVIVTWKKILVVLKREGIVKEKRLLHPRRILAHPKNRGGLMLNGFNVRANGSKVAKVGANRSELHGATVIEMSPFSATSKEQIEENVKLAEKSVASSLHLLVKSSFFPWRLATWSASFDAFWQA